MEHVINNYLTNNDNNDNIIIYKKIQISDFSSSVLKK